MINGPGESKNWVQWVNSPISNGVLINQLSTKKGRGGRGEGEGGRGGSRRRRSGYVAFAGFSVVHTFMTANVKPPT